MGILFQYTTEASVKKTATADASPIAVSTTLANEDNSDEMIQKNRERMMKKMSAKSPKTTSTGLVCYFVEKV